MGKVIGPGQRQAAGRACGGEIDHQSKESHWEGDVCEREGRPKSSKKKKHGASR